MLGNAACTYGHNNRSTLFKKLLQKLVNMLKDDDNHSGGER